MADYIGTEPAYGVFQRQILIGNGSTTQYNLDYPVAQPTSLLVVLDGVVQEPEYSYSTSIVSGQPVITFSEPLDVSSRASIVYMGRQLLTAQYANSETYIDEFNGDGSTVDFTLTRTPAANNAANFAVFVDNVYQRYGASYSYTVTGDVLTFTGPPAIGTNNIQVIQLNGSNTLNTVANGSISRVKLDFDPEDDATALAIALG